MNKTFSPLLQRWRWLRWRFDFGRYHYVVGDNGTVWDKWWEWEK